MKKTNLIIFFLLAIIGVLGFFLYRTTNNINPITISAGLKNDSNVVCTMDAKQCPDGSYVGRDGPKCEFKKCPVISAPTTSIQTVREQETAIGNIRVGQTVTINNVRITLHSIVQDNRCPVDVQCIEAGAVNAHVTFQNGKNVITFNQPSDEAPYVFGIHTVAIEAINPPRVSKIQPDPSAYVLTFRVNLLKGEF